MAPRPTVIGTQGYRRGLASLSVVKELYSESIGMPRSAVLRPRFHAWPLCGHAK